MSSSSSRFTSFQFAPNGVCIHPALFQCKKSKARSTPTTTTTTSTSSTTTQQNNNNPTLSSSSLPSLFTMRNVNGTQGDCIFEAVVLASLTSVGLGGNDALLTILAKETRTVVANLFLQLGGIGRRNDSNENNENDDNNKYMLVVEDNKVVSIKALLTSAARTEGLSPLDYVQKLKNGTLYGGGPELTVLANLWRRPISIYELVNENSNDVNDVNDDSNDNHQNDNNADDDKRKKTHNKNKNDKTTTTIQQIQCMGTFGKGVFQDPLLSSSKVLRNKGNSAILHARYPPGAYSWHLHILIVNVTEENTEKHACVLLPQPPPLSLLPQ